MANPFEILKSRINDSIKNTVAEIGKAELEQFKEKVKDSIQSGLSPVESKVRLIDYSISYKDSIKKGYYDKYNKKLRPVNMTLSGKMIDSLYVEKTPTGFEIGFSDDRKLAWIHTVEGAGKSKVIRKLLPVKGEYFSRSITSFLTKIVTQSWIDAFKINKDKI
jgi:hypothetical protein